MYEELFQEIGLSKNESRVYEALLQIGEASVQLISNKSNVHRRNVYDSLSKLIGRGLVSEAFVKGEKNFKATDPERLVSIIREKEQKLSKSMPDLKKKFKSIKQDEQAYIYKGVQGFRNYMQDILDVGEDFYTIGAKGGWFDPRLETFRHRFYREFNKKKLNAYHLFDWEMKEEFKTKEETPVKIHKAQARFLPKKCSTNSAIDFFGDRIVTFTGLKPNLLGDDMVQFVIISRKLTDSYKKWFWFMWDHCKE